MSPVTMHRTVSRVVRTACGLRKTPYKIRVVLGSAAPTLVGESYRHETRGGRRIYRPSAYARKGWSNMIYVPSTLSIEVGGAWLTAALLATV